LYDKVFQVERYRVRYAGYLDLLARYWLTEENISNLAYQYQNMISPYLIQGDGDKMFFGDTAMFPIEAFNDAWMQYGEFARQRSEYIQSVLADDGWRSPDYSDANLSVP
jgi:hypothetical protein